MGYLPRVPGQVAWRRLCPCPAVARWEDPDQVSPLILQEDPVDGPWGRGEAGGVTGGGERCSGISCQARVGPGLGGFLGWLAPWLVPVAPRGLACQVPGQALRSCSVCCLW